MAGITDLPFRQMTWRLGAGYVVSEMMASKPTLMNTRKSELRRRHDDTIRPRVVQIAGGDADVIAAAAAVNVRDGADIIDINMGCPAKKVCNKAAGSALLRDEVLVGEILEAVVAAVDVPVTVKIRTGWSKDEKNAVRVGKIAEGAGVRMICVHGRTRACRFSGAVEYDSIAAVKQAVSIPVVANGDVATLEDAAFVLSYTSADAIMIGRAALGAPWLPGRVAQYLASGVAPEEPSVGRKVGIMVEHVRAMHEFYGPMRGLRIARKHVQWYLRGLKAGRDVIRSFNVLETESAQIDFLNRLM